MNHGLAMIHTVAGLCDSCKHAEQITSKRGSIFWLCQLSKVDDRFPKYPRLPVLQCDGYTGVAQPDPAS